MESLLPLLRTRGFSVWEEVAEYATLTGGRIREDRLVAVSGDGRLKITVARASGVYRLTILAVGSRASSSLASSLEDLGASIDYEEDRLVAVFRLSTLPEVKRVINGIMG